MKKEERELKKYVLGPEHPMNASVIRSMITALIRAVREDCAEVAESEELSGMDSTSANHASAIAAAIRGRK